MIMRQLWILLTLIIFALPVFGQNAYTGIYHKTNSGRKYLRNITWNKLIESQRSFKAKGFQLIDVEARHEGKGKSVRFWAIWQKKSEESKIQSLKGWDAFKEENKALFQKGYKLVDIESYLDKNAERRYLGVYEKGTKPQRTRKYTTYDAFVKGLNSQKSEGYALSEIDFLTTKDKKIQVMAVFHKGPRNVYFRSKTFKEFNELRKKQAKNGLQLLDFESYKEGTQNWYVAIMQNTGKKASFWHNLNWDSFKAHRTHLGKHRDLYLVDIEVKKKRGNTAAPPSHTAKLKDTPDIYQHMTGIDSRPSRNPDKEFERNFCGPCAASNAFMYLANNGYAKLKIPVATLGNDPLRQQIKMVDILADPGYMDTRDNEGTGQTRFIKGVWNYIAKAGLKVK